MLKTKNKINQIDKDTILSNMSEGVLAIDNNKRLLMINKTGEEYLEDGILHQRMLIDLIR